MYASYLLLFSPILWYFFYSKYPLLSFFFIWRSFPYDYEIYTLDYSSWMNLATVWTNHLK